VDRNSIPEKRSVNEKRETIRINRIDSDRECDEEN